MIYILYILAAVVGYLLGSINGAQIVGKLHGIDIKKEGSGNAGTTNVLRTLGKKAAVFTLLFDSLKGVAACIAGSLIVGYNGLLVAGFAAVLGHNWPIFFKFKGGKGVLTTFVVLLVIDWQVALILFGIFLIIVAVCRMVSLGSVVVSILAFIIAAAMHRELFEIVILILLGGLIVFKHRSNIVRILNGSEHKLGEKKA